MKKMCAFGVSALVLKSKRFYSTKSNVIIPVFVLIGCWIASGVVPLYGKMLVKFECWKVGGPQLLAKYGGYAVDGKALENDVPQEWASPAKKI